MLFKRLAAALLLRRISRDLTAIASSLDAQTQLLARLADKFAPALPREVPQSALVDTGISHLDPIEAGLALDYIARTQADTGYTPDEDEILIHLADEKTQDLHTRLIAREQELDRLQERRR